MAEKLDIAAKVMDDYAKKKFAEYEEKIVKFREAYEIAAASTLPYSGTYSRGNGKIWPNDAEGIGASSGNPTTFGALFKWLFNKETGTLYIPLEQAFPSSGNKLDEVTGAQIVDERIGVANYVPSAEKEDGTEREFDDLIEAKIGNDPANKPLLDAYKVLSSGFDRFRLYYSYKEIIEKITPAKYTESVAMAFVNNMTSAGIKKIDPGDLYEFWYGMQGRFLSSQRGQYVGASDIVSRNYPLMQDKFGDDVYVHIDYPWKDNDAVLLDAIKEKSDDPSVNTPPPAEASSSGIAGTSGTSGTNGTSGAPQKYKPFVEFPEGVQDGFQVDAKTDLPDFKIYVSDPETWKQLGTEDAVEGEDAFSNVDGAEEDDEYSETAFQGSEEEQIKLDLTTFLSQGDSEGGADDDTAGGGGGDTGPSGGDVQTGGGVNTNKSQSAGGSGDRRFQKQMTINGRVVKNGELPDDLLAKLDFCGFKVEKNAARRLNELNVAYKAQFGKNIALSGGFRTFKTQNDIFDWDYYDKYKKGRKKGTNGGVAAATPGGSKHGWGQAIDCSGFGNGPGNKYFDWMEANAKKYGWVNPAWAKKSGAGYEPWHWEYIGSDLFK